MFGDRLIVIGKPLAGKGHIVLSDLPLRLLPRTVHISRLGHSIPHSHVSNKQGLTGPNDTLPCYPNGVVFPFQL